MYPSAFSADEGTALVTGAAQGICRAIALRLASDGFSVALNDIASKVPQLDILAEEIQANCPGVAASVHTADVSQEGEVQAMIDAVVQKHGSLDVVLLTTVSAEQWDHIMSVNTRGSAYGKQGGADFASYCASKFAVRGLTQSAALEFGKYGITVNAYAPGPIETAMRTPSGTLWGSSLSLPTLSVQVNFSHTCRFPTDIANFVSFIASKESLFITGTSRFKFPRPSIPCHRLYSSRTNRE
ncbi:acetoin reductase family protein [Roridomyces roridus]|uniref:Acetoin reductase family protein n=1 Tax=Roridomyces roridus TaxID=1738132 RepID=A0AAD7BRV8_9AGAR|nr:acetoin reductase family protein [Roridomyces roridus]